MKINKKMGLCFAVLVLSVFGTGSLYTNILYAESAGPKAYTTGAPGDDACDVCHFSFARNSGSAKFSIKAPATCMHGKSIKITVSFTQSVGQRTGFEMTAVDANGNRVGTFQKIGTTTQVITPNDSRGLQSQDAGKYIEHTAIGSTKKSWKVKWKVPAGAANPITFYASGVDANGNGAFDNDYVYTATASTTAR